MQYIHTYIYIYSKYTANCTSSTISSGTLDYYNNNENTANDDTGGLIPKHAQNRTKSLELNSTLTRAIIIRCAC